MSCKYPNVILQNFNSINPETMKPLNEKFWGSHEWLNEGHTYEELEKLNSKSKETGYKFKKIPCGKCIGCRLDYSKDWAVRCMAEAKTWEENYFVTLTYDNDNLPMPEKMYVDTTGEIFENWGNWKGCLEKEHLRKFLKDLRRYFEYHYGETNIRFFACGEYGGKGERPHYHLIIFNLPLKKNNVEMTPFFINKNKQQIYLCETIEKIWGKGLISVGGVDWNSCAYVARYVTKKINGEGSAEHYASKGQIKEFSNMSRMPGIGRDYFETHKEMYENDEMDLLMKSIKGQTIKPKPSKYYDRLYDLECPEAMAAIKEHREKMGINSMKSKCNQTSLKIHEQLQVEERTLLDKAKILKREMIET